MKTNRLCLGLALLATSALLAAEKPLTAQWVGMDALCWDWRAPVLPAPTYRGIFQLDSPCRGLKIAVCGLGYFVCRVDGRPVSDAILMPGETQFDVRWRYRVFALPELSKGRHVVTVTCGDGLYRPSTAEVWHFDKATWSDYPKAACEIRTEAGQVIFQTDSSWQWRPSPTVVSSLRGGETFDARQTFPDDGQEGWKSVLIVPPPGGVGEEETYPPCRVRTVYAMTNRLGTAVWDAPVTLAGNVRIRVKGARGAKVSIVSAERLSADGRHVDLRPLDCMADLGKNEKTFQRDAYILSGEGEEVWSPQFTYHGFQHAELTVEGDAKVLSVEALEINNDFARLGRIVDAPAPVLRVLTACERSILGNFHNIPTDCPQREKNGWTSESRLMCEAALYSFDAGSAYGAFADVIGDTQRPSGQISGIAPCNGWGYNWGCGPAWDTALLEIPDDVYRFTGDRRPIERLYAKIVRYLDFENGMLDAEGVPAHGLGDWLPASGEYSDGIVRLGFHVRNLKYGERFARLLGKTEDAAVFAHRRQLSTEAFRRKFCDADGLSTAKTSLPHAIMLEVGLVPDHQRAACAARLAQVVERNGARVDYGTLGSRCVLRMLFEHGYADLGWRMMTQPDFPGYVFFTETVGLTTLPERWNIHISPEEHGGSRNHGAFSDYLAVAYRHLGGIRHTWERPGRDFVEVRPSFPSGLASFACTHEGYAVSWKRTSGQVSVSVVVPAGKTARYVHADGRGEEIGEGVWSFAEGE